MALQAGAVCLGVRHERSGSRRLVGVVWVGLQPDVALGGERSEWSRSGALCTESRRERRRHPSEEAKQPERDQRRRWSDWRAMGFADSVTGARPPEPRGGC